MVRVLIALLLTLLTAGTALAGSTTTSGVTAQTVIDRVRYDLNETIASFWTDAELTKWIDESVKEIVYRTRCLEAGVSTVTLSQSVRTYSLSGLSYLDIEKVEHNSGVTTDPLYIFDLERAQFRNLRYGMEKEKGRPKVFAVWRDSLYIWPIPDSTQSGTTCYVYYVPIPSGVTAVTSPIETPSYFDSAIYDYVKSRALMKDAQIEQAGAYMSSFNSRIMNYIVNVLRRNIFELPSQATTPPK